MKETMAILSLIVSILALSLGLYNQFQLEKNKARTDQLAFDKRVREIYDSIGGDENTPNIVSMWRNRDRETQTKVKHLLDELDTAHDEHEHIYLLKSYYAAMKGNYDEQSSHLGKALKLNPRFTSAHVALGSFYFYQQENEKAIASYKKALTLEPDTWVAYLGLGNIHYKMGDYQEALKNYRASSDIEKDAPEPLIGVSNSFERLGYYACAKKYCQEAHELNRTYALAKQCMTDLSVYKQKLCQEPNLE